MQNYFVQLLAAMLLITNFGWLYRWFYLNKDYNQVWNEKNEERKLYGEKLEAKENEIFRLRQLKGLQFEAKENDSAYSSDSFAQVYAITKNPSLQIRLIFDPNSELRFTPMCTVKIYINRQEEIVMDFPTYYVGKEFSLSQYRKGLFVNGEIHFND